MFGSMWAKKENFVQELIFVSGIKSLSFLSTVAEDDFHRVLKNITQLFRLPVVISWGNICKWELKQSIFNAKVNCVNKYKQKNGEVISYQ